MRWRQKILKSHISVTEAEANRHSQRLENAYAIAVRPPMSGDLPATLYNVVQGILEIQNKWLGFKNTSPTIAFEIHRPQCDKLRLQYVVPTKRLERKVRTQLSDQIEGIGFDTGTTQLPIELHDSIGGGILHCGIEDWYPFESEFSSPPSNALTALLHRDAMKDTKIVVQVLFKPIAARSPKNSWWRRKAVSQRDRLRGNGDVGPSGRTPSSRERKRAKAIDTKIGTARFWTAVRFAAIGAGEQTPSRVKELSGGFNRFENPDTDQYFNAEIIYRLRRSSFLDFYQAIHNREFAGWSRRFRTTPQELAALLAVPDRTQRNIQTAKP